MQSCSETQFKKNCQKLMERFCHISFLSHPFSFLDKNKKEKKEYFDDQEFHLDLDKVLLEKVETIYVYGLGMGQPFFDLQIWLEQKKERDLIFIEDDLQAVNRFLHLPSAKTILDHVQVHLHYFATQKEMEKCLDDLAEKFPVASPIVLAIAGYEKKSFFPNLRKQILRKTTLSEAFFCDRLNAHHQFIHFLENLKQLPCSFYANKWKNSFQNIPAIICGAGPSLEASLPSLEKWKNHALILAGGSAIVALSQKGIIPHLGMAVDPNDEEWKRMKKSLAFEMPILFSTRVHSQIFSALNGFAGYLRSGLGGVGELWVDEELKLTDPLIGEKLPEESLSVTLLCLCYAELLGCNPIILCGVDLSYQNQRRYPMGVVEKEEFSSEKGLSTFARDERFQMRGIDDRKVITAMRWIMEKDSIFSFVKKHPHIRFYNATQRGLKIPSMDHVSLEEFFQKESFPQMDIGARVHQLVMDAFLEVSQDTIDQLLNKVEKSLSRCHGILSLMLKEIDSRDVPSESGRLALFHMDLKEEMAYTFLLYDLESILDRFLQRAYKKPSFDKSLQREKWSHMQTIIETYLDGFSKK